MFKRLHREVSNMKKMDHSNVIKIFESKLLVKQIKERCKSYINYGKLFTVISVAHVQLLKPKITMLLLWSTCLEVNFMIMFWITKVWLNQLQGTCSTKLSVLFNTATW